jgi:CheY-like chemotaxis protein
MKTLLTGKNILVVDDEELLREILVEDLTSAGASVKDAANGSIAFEILQKQRFDAVVTDIRMPGGNGIKLIKNINSHFQKDKPKIFVCSGYNDMTLEETEALSVSFTFDKPFDRETFIKTLAQYLAK